MCKAECRHRQGSPAGLVGAGKLPKGDPCTGVVGLSLSGRGGGDGIPSVGKRVAMLPEQGVTWRDAGKLGGLEHRAKGEAGEEAGFGFYSKITARTTKSLPSVLPVFVVSGFCLSKGKEWSRTWRGQEDRGRSRSDIR